MLVLLTLLLLQAVSGLFGNDDILFSGPLYYAASDELVGFMGTVHHLAFDGIVVMVVLHILAVLYHQFVKKENLIGAMLAGRARGRAGLAPAVPLWRFVLLLVILAAALWYASRRPS